MPTMVSAPAVPFQTLAPGLDDFLAATALPLAWLYEKPYHVVDTDMGGQMFETSAHARGRATQSMQEFETHGTLRAAIRRPASGKKCPSPSRS